MVKSVHKRAIPPGEAGADPLSLPPSGAVPTEAWFRALLESAPDAIVIVDHTGQIVLVNSRSEELFGYDRADLTGQSIELLVPDQLRSVHTQDRAHYYAHPQTRPIGSGRILLARRKDGSEFSAEISLSPVQTENGLLVMSVIRDISERRRAAEELEQQVQRRTAHLNALLQVSSELLAARSRDAMLERALIHALALVPQAARAAIYLYDPETDRLALRAGLGAMPITLPIDPGILGAAFTSRQTYRASSVAAVLDRARAEGVEAPLISVLDPEHPPSGVLAIPLSARDQAIGVLGLVRDSGEGPFAAEAQATVEGLANLTATAILEERSRHEAAALSSQLADLEEQQRTMAARLTTVEAGMLQTARLAAVGELAAAVAHEINNPLYAARNCLYLLEEDLPPALRDSPYMNMARDQLARIATIIERMRDFYRPARGELAPYNLNRGLEETLELAALNLRKLPIKMIFTPDPALPPVVCDSDQLRQVFLNLILNAIDAMPEGGTLTVRTEAGPTMALVEIADTGIGIPPEVRERLFEPFFTTKPSGTGLGLSISAHIVTQHGGQILVESQEGQGSTFRVVLPYHPDI
jgi:two-component system, NtrC family, sensor kinase